MSYSHLTKEEIIDGLKNYSIDFKDLSEDLLNDKSFIIQCIKNNTRHILSYIKEDLLFEEDIFVEIINDKYFTLNSLPKVMFKDFNIALKGVREDGGNLYFLIPYYGDNKEIVLEAVKQSGMALYWVSERLQGDEDVVLAAVQQNGHALKYSSEKIQNDKIIVITAMKNKGKELEFVIEKFKNDKEIVLEAVKQNGRALLYASSVLQEDIELLEILNNIEKEGWKQDELNWYKERMELLANLRQQEDKQYMESSILPSNKSSKTIKF